MLSNLPFAALRAFEAVVRRSSFQRAADELGVSQSAVSQHVRALEEWTGKRLLVRGARETRPTPAGADLAVAVADGFGRVDEVCRRLRRTAPRGKALAISCLPGFALSWLFPRLIRFDALHPEISLSISTDPNPVDLAAGAADLAIRYGRGHYPGLYVRKLLAETLIPVCAPALLQNGPPLRQPADLAAQTLLVDDLSPVGGRPPTWEFWAAATGVELPQPRRLRRFGQSNMVVQAAIEGLGVALGRDTLVAEALAEGRLVPLFDLAPVASDYSYWFVCPESGLADPAVKSFHDWVLQEAESFNK